MNSPVTRDRLLVFDCHEAWVYQLRLLDQQMDVVVGLKGRHMAEWDDAMRPVPPNARIVQLDAALAAAEPYYCIIAHNLSDLLDVKTLAGPRLFVIHGTLEGMVSDQQTVTQPDELRRTVAQFIRLIGAHAIAVSKLKGCSWGFDQDIVSFAADPGDYLPYRGDLPCGLRIANSIRSRRRTLLWDFHEMAFSGVPMTLVGRNDDMPGVEPAHDWAELKQILSRHRFFVHTADPKLEDGYNMATLEQCAAAVKQAGFVNVEVRDRNEWYFALAQRELAAMEAELRPVIIERIGPERAEHFVADWRQLVLVLGRGELRPGHLKAVKPAP